MAEEMGIPNGTGAVGSEGTKQPDELQPTTEAQVQNLPVLEPQSVAELKALFAVPPADSKATESNLDGLLGNYPREIPKPDQPTSAWRYLNIRLSDSFLSQGKVERPVISQESLDDFKRRWYGDNWQLMQPDGTVDLQPALNKIGTEMEMSALMAKYLTSSEPGFKDTIEPLDGNASIWERWLGTETAETPPPEIDWRGEREKIDRGIHARQSISRYLTDNEDALKSPLSTGLKPLTEILSPQEAQAAYMAGREIGVPVQLIAEDGDNITVQTGPTKRVDLTDYWQARQQINAGIYNKDDTKTEPEPRGVLTKYPAGSLKPLGEFRPLPIGGDDKQTF